MTTVYRAEDIGKGHTPIFSQAAGDPLRRLALGSPSGQEVEEAGGAPDEQEDE